MMTPTGIHTTTNGLRWPDTAMGTGGWTRQRRARRRELAAALVTLVSLIALVAMRVPQTARAGASAPHAWSITGHMKTARIFQTITLLSDGRVLVAGGSRPAMSGQVNALASAELYDPQAGRWSATGQMRVARRGATATLLRDGRVLVAGGETTARFPPSTSELYHPRTGAWTMTGRLTTSRRFNTAVLLPYGRVLVAASGCCQEPNSRASAELYDPRTGAWTATGHLKTDRVFHTMTLLPDGRVLVAGGTDDLFRPLASAELYDPRTGAWTPARPMRLARALHAAALLRDGRVLVVGGRGFDTSAELYDPRTNRWSATGRLRAGRTSGVVAPLADGRVLVAGGCCDHTPAHRPLTEAEVYDPATGLWTATTPMLAPCRGAATALSTGAVLVTGCGAGSDLSGAELFT